MQISELNHVALHVADVETSVAFYRDVMGLKQLPRPAFDFPGAWFALGTQELHLIGGRNQAVHSHNRGTHFALQVRSIREAETQLQAAGAEYRPAKKRPDGAWQVFLADPDGHVIELCDLGDADSSVLVSPSP
ncbi:MAG: VOC family protein [Phycisphaerae bacterium]|nr:VOC family protein [Phycisphaerae bacterium]